MTNNIKGVKKLCSELKRNYPHAFGTLITEVYYNPEKNSVSYNTTLAGDRFLPPDTDTDKFLFVVDSPMSMAELAEEIEINIQYYRRFVW